MTGIPTQFNESQLGRAVKKWLESEKLLPRSRLAIIPKWQRVGNCSAIAGNAGDDRLRTLCAPGNQNLGKPSDSLWLCARLQSQQSH
jgi:hypothetical protein